MLDFGTDSAYGHAGSTDRGFTGHEHLDDLGVIHMNGRTYDPLIGRFMQADPIVSMVDNLQAFNRYSYVYNNPLNLTDPSGECPICPMLISMGIAAGMEGGLYVLTNVVMGAAIGYGSWTLLETGDIKLAVKASFTAAASAGVFHSIGTHFARVPIGVDPATWKALHTLSHAAAGCVMSAAQGGSCRNGAVSAAVGKLVTFGAGAILPGNEFFGGVAAALAGGAASKAVGGKFEEGALTAAFGYLFNYCTQFTAKCMGEWALNGAKVVGGGLQTASGVALCTTVVACIGGAAVSVVGASQVIQGVTYFDNPDIDGFNPVKQAFQGVAVRFGGTATAGASLYHLTEVVTGFGAMAAPITATTGWISMGTRDPMTRSYGSISYPSYRLEQAGRAAIGINIGSGAAKVYNTLRPEPQ